MFLFLLLSLQETTKQPTESNRNTADMSSVPGEIDLICPPKLTLDQRISMRYFANPLDIVIFGTIADDIFLVAVGTGVTENLQYKRCFLDDQGTIDLGFICHVFHEFVCVQLSGYTRDDVSNVNKRNYEVSPAIESLMQTEQFAGKEFKLVPPIQQPEN